VPVTVEQLGAECFIRLEGEITIVCAAELKKVLLDALASGNKLRLDLKGATDLDITALQLLWAAEREAQASGRSFKLTGRVPEEILHTANHAGLEIFSVGRGLAEAGNGEPSQPGVE
jgi:anti-anti-sigma factor